MRSYTWTERQHRQALVVRAERHHLQRRLHVGPDVVVGEDHALGVAGRAGRVDQRGDRVGRDGERFLAHPRVLGGDRPALGLELGERHHAVPLGARVERDHVPQRGEVAPDLRDLGHLLGGRAEHADRARVLEDVLGLPGRQRRDRWGRRPRGRTGRHSPRWPIRGGFPRGSRSDRPAAIPSSRSPSVTATTRSPSSRCVIACQVPPILARIAAGRSP